MFKTYQLKTEALQMIVTNAGASVVSLKVKDNKDNWQDVVLGYEEVDTYVTTNDACFGSVVGRHANRIKSGIFELNQKTYQLEKNNGGNNLHSGSKGFHLREWQVESVSDKAITFLMISPDGDQGFPGNMEMRATYQLEGNQVTINYIGLSDQTTLFNPTNHSYFNLSGHQDGNVLDHLLQLPCRYFMPIGEDSVPTGERRSVSGTPMDYLTPKPIETQFDLSNEQLRLGNGLDHHFVLAHEEEAMVLNSPKTGITLEVTTNMPGVQIYTANFVKDVKGKEGVVYQERSGICLETQHCPNSINLPEEKSPILESNQEISYQTKWQFTTN